MTPSDDREEAMTRYQWRQDMQRVVRQFGEEQREVRRLLHVRQIEAAHLREQDTGYRGPGWTTWAERLAQQVEHVETLRRDHQARRGQAQDHGYER